MTAAQKCVSISRVLVALATISLSLAGVAPVARAATVTQWNFNLPLGANNSPATSTGAGSATPVGMTGGLNNADIVAATGTPPSPDPAVTDNAWRVRGTTNNGWSGTTPLLSGAQFNVSTAGNDNILVYMEVHATDGSPRHAQFQYTTDGTNFTSFGSLIDFNTSFNGFAPRVWDLSSVAGVSNNPSFGFKLVSAFNPNSFTNANGTQAANTAFQRADAESGVYTGGAGNWRFDLVTVASIPEPASAALIVCGLATGLLLSRRKRSVV